MPSKGLSARRTTCYKATLRTATQPGGRHTPSPNTLNSCAFSLRFLRQVRFVWIVQSLCNLFFPLIHHFLTTIQQVFSVFPQFHSLPPSMLATLIDLLG